MNLIQLQPDDVLVLRCPGHLNKTQLDAMTAQLRFVLGETQRVIILDGGQSLDVLRGVDIAAKDDAQRTIWRQEYNALSPADREANGSFAGFVADKGGVAPYARGTDELEAEGIPPHVWLYRNMLTDHQIECEVPIGRNETNGQYAVAIDQLTYEQRAIPHVSRQLPGDVLTVAVDSKVGENEIVRRA